LALLELSRHGGSCCDSDHGSDDCGELHGVGRANVGLEGGSVRIDSDLIW
jgi:hypothetical protein